MASSSMAAQTWPYVTIGWRFGDDEIGIGISNDGLGPAIIRDVVLTIDQKPQHDAVSALRPFLGNPPPQVRLDAVTRGVVIRAGNSVNFFLVHDVTAATQIRDAMARVNLQLCYCSILGKCWTSSLGDANPEGVSRCAEGDPNGLALPRADAGPYSNPLALNQDLGAADAAAAPSR
jgi:hypothetical protein